jgi:alkylation response protein AidB-like acyl-CoA dehydrogenase
VPRCKGLLARLRRIAAAAPAGEARLIDQPHFARRLAQAEIDTMAHEATLWRVVAEEAASPDSGSTAASILKVRGTELVQRIGALTVEALGDDALPAYNEHDYLLGTHANAPGSDLAPGVTADFLYRRSASIYGGTNEVQRNIIAAQLLRA